MKNNYSAIIPIKAESSRVPNKNFLELAGKPLYYWIVECLQKVEFIDDILIDTNCPEKIQFSNWEKINIHQRIDRLSANEITMNSLLEDNLQHCKNERIVQTHVTNPLVQSKTVRGAIAQYEANIDDHDSLLTVDRIQKRLYNSDGSALNHDLKNMLQTQDLDPVFAENSNLFIFSKSSFASNDNSRIGRTPGLFEMGFPESLDIDQPDDFKVAEVLLAGGYF